ncbi:MAG: bifunctional folylpolyglutamate synthase/dihydrofolate synthase [Prevotella sp.]
MTYRETTEYLFNQLPMFERNGAKGYKSGLENTLSLDVHFGHPHSSYKTIHVAGTNGKGSCSSLIAAMLQTAGYKVGLYTSPHLVDFRERIRVNGRMVSEQYVIDFVEKERHFFEPMRPSFFELTTAMAFKYFEDMKVDIAVIETGLGGRLDCTNIINPILSIITNISYDHTQFLGNTLDKIAAEKAGIIKDDVPVIIGNADEETKSVFLGKALETHSEIIFAQGENNKEVTKVQRFDDSTLLYITRSFGDIKCSLVGTYQEENVNTVLVAIKNLMKQGYLSDCTTRTGRECMRKELSEAFVNVTKLTGLRGRWQTVKTAPRVVCDTGHNLGGWEFISRQLKATNCKQMHIIFGMVDDKDIDSVLNLLPKNALYYFTEADNRRAIPWLNIQEKAVGKGLSGGGYPTVKEAFAAALRRAAHDDFIFVGGSSYVVADFLKECI